MRYTYGRVQRIWRDEGLQRPLPRKRPNDGWTQTEIPLNRGGNRQANATLHRIVDIRLRWHEQSKGYAARELKEGRSKAEIMRFL